MLKIELIIWMKLMAYLICHLVQLQVLQVLLVMVLLLVIVYLGLDNETIELDGGYADKVKVVYITSGLNDSLLQSAV